MPIQSTTFSFNFESGGTPAPGTGAFTAFAPRDAGATVAANVVKKYRTPDAVATDQGDGSLLHLGAKLVVQNLQDAFRMGSFADEAAVAINSRTFGTSTVGNNSGAAGTAPTGFDPLLASSLPLYEVTSVSIDGTAVDRILYTTGDATAATLDDSGNGEVLVNPKTGSWKVSRNTSGAGAGVVFAYKTPDLTPLKAQALLQPIEVVTFAGWRYNEQYFGVYDDLVAWASANNIMVYAAVDDSAVEDDADFVTLVNAIRSDSFQTLAAKLTSPTEDLTSAYAALQAGSPVNGTLKGKAAPRGVTYSTTLPYTRDEYGDAVDPSVGTFHYIGVNAVTVENGVALITDDRAMTAYSLSTDVLFGGIRRTLNATNALVKFYSEEALNAEGDQTPIFDEQGLTTLKGAVKNGLNKAAEKRWIRESYTLTFPELEDTLEADRKRRFLDGTHYDITVTTAIHVMAFTVGVRQ